MAALAVIPLAYLLGSLPFGWLMAKLTKGVDVRDFGSGKTGMTNVMRVVGFRAAAVVMAADMGKGALAVVAARALLSDSLLMEGFAGFLAIVGHNWPVFLKLRGGRGIATGLGVLFVVSPVTALAALALVIPTIAISRMVSLGSLLGVGAAFVILIALSLGDYQPREYAFYALLAGPLLLFQSRDNLQRILRGTERKLGEPPVKRDDSSPPPRSSLPR